MKDRSIKYSEEYIRVIVEDLRRDFQTKVSGLQQHHEEALRKWKQDSSISSALEAAYHEDLEQLKTDFTIKLNEVQEDVNSLIDVNSQRIKQQLLLLQSKIQDLFRLIHQSAVVIASVLFLRSENFFE